MIISTTSNIDGQRVTEYLGIVSGEAIMGANFVRDFFAKIRDVVGGQAGGYEKVLKDARDAALEEMQDEAESLGIPEGQAWQITPEGTALIQA